MNLLDDNNYQDSSNLTTTQIAIVFILVIIFFTIQICLMLDCCFGCRIIPCCDKKR